MSIEEKKSETPAETKKSVKYTVKPKYGMWTEEDKVILQIALPGVKKEDIEMKTLTNYFNLKAPRKRFQYSLELNFGIDIEPDKTNAEYQEGLLKVEFEIYKPLEHAYEVPIE